MQEIRPTIIRGNASEIRSLLHAGLGAKGVDSRDLPNMALDDARAISRSTGCVVSVSGPVDLIVEGEAVAQVENGHPMMSRVTGMGCTASAVTGAFSAVNPSAFKAAVHAMAAMGIAGEMAAEAGGGPGSFQVRFLDALYRLQESDIEKRIRIKIS